MNHRPDIDEDVRRIRERPGVDGWNVLQMLAALNEGGDRRRVLAHFASAALHATIRGDIAALQARGVRAVPVCVGRDSTMLVEAPDRTRRVNWVHSLQRGSIDINFYYVDRRQETLCASLKLPINRSTDYAQLPAEVRKRADEIRAFLLHGERPEDDAADVDVE